MPCDMLEAEKRQVMPRLHDGQQVSRKTLSETMGLDYEAEVERLRAEAMTWAMAAGINEEIIKETAKQASPPEPEKPKPRPTSRWELVN